MKKSLLSLSLISVFFITNSFAQNKKVAVVTFYVVRKIGLDQFGSTAQVANRLIEDPNFNMEPLLKNFHAQFFDNYAKQFPFDLVPEETVLNNEAYKAFTPLGSEGNFDLLKDNYNLPYPGYKVVLPVMGHGNERKLLEILKTDGVMKVYVDFDLVKFGFGNMGVVRVNAFANIALFNKNGDKVFSIRENAKSKSVSPLVGGVPVITPEKILPMCESALTELMVDLQKDLPKMIKKSDAKL